MESYNYTQRELELINNIVSVDLYDIVRMEKLSFDFVINFVLNEKYQKTREEQEISLSTVYCYQPHLRGQINELLQNKTTSY
jgi:hypothetical protein